MVALKNKYKNIVRNQGNSQYVVINHTYPRLIEWTAGSIITLVENKYFKYTLFILLPVAMLSYYPSILGDYDIWFHLAYGKHFVQNFTWTIDHTVFSWTNTDADWKYVTWIGSCIIYLAYKIGDLPGIYFFQYTVMSGMYYMMFYFVKKIKQKYQIWHALNFLMIAIALKLVGIYIKPEMFTTLLFAITACLLFWVRIHKKYNLFYLYPVVFMIWVNTHGGFLFGLFFVTVMFCLDFFNFILISKQTVTERYLYHFGIAIGLSYISILFNPYGIQYHFDLIKYAVMPEYMGEARRLYAYLSLWDYVKLTTNSYNFVNSALVLLYMIVVMICYSFYVYRKKKYWIYL